MEKYTNTLNKLKKKYKKLLKKNGGETILSEKKGGETILSEEEIYLHFIKNYNIDNSLGIFSKNI